MFADVEVISNNTYGYNQFTYSIPHKFKTKLSIGSFVRVEFRNKIEFVDESEYDYHLPMGSLPLYLRPSLKSFEEAKEFNYQIMKLSGTEFRKKLRNGEPIPEWFAFKSVVDVLRSS